MARENWWRDNLLYGAKIKHGVTIGGGRTSEYVTWKAMRKRCRDSKSVGYRLYGQRGIKVCDRWNDFEAFLEDMGPRPSPEHSLDRIDNDGNYEPSNCRWATKKEQSNNRRVTIFVDHRGKRVPLAEAARELNIKYATAFRRVAAGQSFSEPRR